LKERVHKAARYFALFSDPHFRSPRIAKGGGDVRPLISVWNKRYNDPEVAYITSSHAEGVQPAQKSYSFAWAGHHALRTGWGEKATWLFFDAGPRGTGHHDNAQLGIQLKSNGQWLLMDPGFYSYSGEGDGGLFSSYLHQTAAHNTMCVDGLNQRDVAFADANTEPQDYGWQDDSQTVTVQGTFTHGYGRAGEVQATHQRQITFNQTTGNFTLVDTLTGEGEHTGDLHWQLPPDAQVTIDGNTLTVDAGETLMVMSFTCDSPLQLTQYIGQREPFIAGWFSQRYGHITPAPMVTVSATAALPLTITTKVEISAK